MSETDQELEALIDRAGRDRVFALAAANGWGLANAPPKWVWRQLAEQVLSHRTAPPAGDGA